MSSIAKGGAAFRLRSRVALLAVAAALAGLAPMGASAQADKPLVLARSMDLNSLDPHRSFCDTCQIYDSSVYETLVTLDPDNKLVPLLATKWEVADGQTRFTFQLAPEAKFSDGSPVEAKDVKWSWERLRNLKGSPSFLMSTLKTIETPDARTVVVTLSTPNSEFLNIAAAPYAAIVNSDVAEKAGAKAGADAATTDTAEPWFLQNSAGSGPYVLKRYEPNNELRLARNEAYWRKPAPIGEVVFRQVKDAVTQAQMLESGAVDIAMQIDPETAKTIRNPDVKVSSIPSYNFIYLALSPRAKANPVPLTPQVREAILLGIDKKGLVEFTIGDKGHEMTAPIPTGFPGSKGFTPTPYDPEKAKKILADAGHAKGFTLPAIFPNMNIYGVDLSTMMQKVQQDLAKIGVKVTLQPVPFATWREQVSSQDGIPLTTAFYAPDFYGTSQYGEYFMMSPDGPWGKRAGASVPGVANPKEPELLKAALSADETKAEELWHQLGQEMVNDRVIIPIVSPDIILAHRSDIKGLRYSACCNTPLAEISR